MNELTDSYQNSKPEGRDMSLVDNTRFQNPILMDVENDPYRAHADGPTRVCYLCHRPIDESMRVINKQFQYDVYRCENCQELVFYRRSKMNTIKGFFSVLISPFKRN